MLHGVILRENRVGLIEQHFRIDCRVEVQAIKNVLNYTPVNMGNLRCQKFLFVSLKKHTRNDRVVRYRPFEIG